MIEFQLRTVCLIIRVHLNEKGSTVPGIYNDKKTPFTLKLMNYVNYWRFCRIFWVHVTKIPNSLYKGTRYIDETNMEQEDREVDTQSVRIKGALNENESS